MSWNLVLKKHFKIWNLSLKSYDCFSKFSDIYWNMIYFLVKTFMHHVLLIIFKKICCHFLEWINFIWHYLYSTSQPILKKDAFPNYWRLFKLCTEMLVHLILILLKNHLAFTVSLFSKGFAQRIILCSIYMFL